MATVTATCHTDGCGNNGEPITFDEPLDENGQLISLLNVVCGPCGQPITDVTTT